MVSVTMRSGAIAQQPSAWQPLHPRHRAVVIPVLGVPVRVVARELFGRAGRASVRNDGGLDARRTRLRTRQFLLPALAPSRTRGREQPASAALRSPRGTAVAGARRRLRSARAARETSTASAVRVASRRSLDSHASRERTARALEREPRPARRWPAALFRSRVRSEPPRRSHAPRPSRATAARAPRLSRAPAVRAPRGARRRIREERSCAGCAGRGCSTRAPPPRRRGRRGRASERTRLSASARASLGFPIRVGQVRRRDTSLARSGQAPSRRRRHLLAESGGAVRRRRAVRQRRWLGRFRAARQPRPRPAIVTVTFRRRGGLTPAA